MKTNSVAYVYSRWIVSNQNCLVGVSWWGRGRNYYWNSVGAKNANGLGLSSIAMLSFRTRGRKARKKHVQRLKLHNIIGVWNEAVL